MIPLEKSNGKIIVLLENKYLIMKKIFNFLIPVSIASILMGCSNNQKSNNETDSTVARTITGVSNIDSLPAPSEAKTKFSNIVGWPEGKTPKAPEGFVVTKFVSDIKSPRWTYIAPNGDVLVALSNSERTTTEKVKGEVTGKADAEVGGKSANTIMLYRDANNDGKPELASTFLSNLNQPLGMLIIGNSFYVANTDGLMKYDYQPGQTKITSKGSKILTLPAGGYNNHWTRNIVANADNSKIYISVGSGSNAGENGMDKEVKKANILEVNPDGSGERIFASGLRNPVGMDWNPETKVLWTSVNERDGLGDDLVPDYITSVQDGGFYGWPYSYFGQHVDSRVEDPKPELVEKAIIPDFALAPHSASLGLTFYDANKFPVKYHNGAFVGQHGSWNRSEFSGYKVIFIPFKDGKPSGKQEDFLTGFIADNDKGDVYGRPVGVTVAKDGALLVADDASGVIWRVAAK